MPELPEVETTRRGIAPAIQGRVIQQIVVRQPSLRWPVPESLSELLIGQSIRAVDRRGKYLLLCTEQGTLIVHLGMSGSLRILGTDQPYGKHDHVDLIFTDRTLLRFNDPRRFGAVLWTTEPVAEHPLLKNLGPEPLTVNFDGSHLYALAQKRRIPVKSFIMDSHNVVGVGNIYANEALFRAGILPTLHVGKISLARYQRLAECIRLVLDEAIRQGGTTLRDFVNEAGKPGYFKQQLKVYGRAALPCSVCGEPLAEIRLSGRSTVFCKYCQR
ncbi:MAG: bifunctional DNA-formamidopyrimidine glycosylase/DNA-(apurinic or apyrimidinic site) lyase [Methylomicrobium sp.]